MIQGSAPPLRFSVSSLLSSSPSPPSQSGFEESYFYQESFPDIFMDNCLHETKTAPALGSRREAPPMTAR